MLQLLSLLLPQSFIPLDSFLPGRPPTFYKTSPPTSAIQVISFGLMYARGRRVLLWRSGSHRCPSGGRAAGLTADEELNFV